MEPAPSRVLMILILLVLFCTKSVTASDGAKKRRTRPRTVDESVLAARKCDPKLVKRPAVPRDLKVTPRKGEKASGYAPVVAYDVLESGEVVNARIERSSGLSLTDEYALRWINGLRFNARPGCGTVESSAVVLVHWE